MIDESQGPKYVAVKIMKQNRFNDRDGIQFYALRELAILQTLQKAKTEYTVQLLDAFLTAQTDQCFDINQPNRICIVMEYLPDDVKAEQWPNLIKGLH